MAIFMDSFQYASAHTQRKWAVEGGTNAVDNSGGPYGRYLQVTIGPISRFISASQDWSVVFQYSIPAAGSGLARRILDFWDAGVIQCALVMNANRTLSFVRGSATSVTGGTSTGAIDPEAWYLIEIKLKISNSIAANDVQVRISGPGIDETITVATGQSVRATSVNSSDTVKITPGGAAVSRFGTFYLDNGQAALLGNVRVAGVRAISNGATVQWTPNTGAAWEAVDDLTPDDDTTKIVTTTDEHIALFNVDGLPTPAQTVLAGQFNVQAKKDDAFDAFIEPVYRIGGTNYFGSPISVGNTYWNLRQQQVNDPSDSNPWTNSKITDTQFGIRSQF